MMLPNYIEWLDFKRTQLLTAYKKLTFELKIYN